MSEGHIPYGRQLIDESDIAAVVEALGSDWLTQGPTVARFEEAVASFCGAKHAVACSSGTAALHLAMLAGGISSGDAVVTSPITFLASANCAFYVGATPGFADVRGDTANLSPEALEAWLTTRASAGGRTAVVPVHFGGTPCEMEAIGRIARDRGALIVEDGCHAIGARYRARDGSWMSVGGCQHSDMTVFSFHPVKHVAMGEGGLVTTNDDGLAARLRTFRNHGMSKDADGFENRDMAFDGGEVAPWYYEMQELGFNFRVTDIQCALGASQLTKLTASLKRRREIAARYREAFAAVPYIQPLAQPEGTEGAYHLFVVRIDFPSIGKTRTQVMTQLRHHGIGTQVHYIPVHLQPYYRRRLGTGPGDFPQAEAYYAEALSLPMYAAMDEGDVERVVDRVSEVVARVSEVSRG